MSSVTTKMNDLVDAANLSITLAFSMFLTEVISFYGDAIHGQFKIIEFTLQAKYI